MTEEGPSQPRFSSFAPLLALSATDVATVKATVVLVTVTLGGRRTATAAVPPINTTIRLTTAARLYARGAGGTLSQSPHIP